MVAENYIKIVKTRLYRVCRNLLTKNWPEYLDDVVKAVNNTPIPGTRNIRPSQFTSPQDNILLSDVEDIPYTTQKNNQQKYELNQNQLQEGDYCFADFPSSSGSFTKGYDTKQQQIFKIKRVLAGKRPVLYKLEDLMGDELENYYYATQLTKIYEKNIENNFFKIEKIVKKKKVRNKWFYLVRYQHYPSKFDQWLEKDTIVQGES